MDDRELLELAAKASGLTMKMNGDGDRFADKQGNGYYGYWNPITDDGDALRLAVKIANSDDRLHSLVWDWTYREIRVFMGGSEGYGDDMYAATRRAIVRAAAAIGKEME
jgi:hypothetical protein